MSSKSDAILNAVITKLGSLALAFPGGGGPLPVRKRKEVRKTGDEATEIAVTVALAEEGDSTRPFAFGVYMTSFPIDIGIIAPGNADNADQLDTYQEWRESIRLAFRDKAAFASIPGIFDCNVVKTPFLPRSAMQQQFDVLLHRIIVQVTE